LAKGALIRQKFSLVKASLLQDRLTGCAGAPDQAKPINAFCKKY